MQACNLLLFLQLDDVKGELLERCKLLPGLSSRVSELENSSDELREKNRQLEQKLATMQVREGFPPGKADCCWPVDLDIDLVSVLNVFFSFGVNLTV